MNFEFHNPTRLIFAAGSLSRLGEVVRQKGKRALVVTGGGCVKGNGRPPGRPLLSEADIVEVLKAAL